jgi:hypothetical protein
LNKYDNIVLFPDKLEKANEMLRKVGLPKQWANEKHHSCLHLQVIGDSVLK